MPSTVQKLYIMGKTGRGVIWVENHWAKLVYTHKICFLCIKQHTSSCALWRVHAYSRTCETRQARQHSPNRLPRTRQTRQTCRHLPNCLPSKQFTEFTVESILCYFFVTDIHQMISIGKSCNDIKYLIVGYVGLD